MHPLHGGAKLSSCAHHQLWPPTLPLTAACWLALLLLQLGSLVPRPAGVPKVKAFIDKHPQAFKYDKANDVVSLVA